MRDRLEELNDSSPPRTVYPQRDRRPGRDAAQPYAGTVDNTLRHPQPGYAGRRPSGEEHARHERTEPQSLPVVRPVSPSLSLANNERYHEGTYQRSLGRDNTFRKQINYLDDKCALVEGNIALIQQLHERALHLVGGPEQKGLTRELDALTGDTSDTIQTTRTRLTKMMTVIKQEGGAEASSKLAQHRKVTQRLQDAAQRYGQARPDLTSEQVRAAIDDPSHESVFAQGLLNPRIGKERKAFEQVQDRQLELEKIESSIEELASLFMELQSLLEKIDTIDLHIDTTVDHIEEGGKEIKKAIVYRQASRKRLWCLYTFLVVFLLLLVIVIYHKACGFRRAPSGDSCNFTYEWQDG
ncbi:Plasma membrane t-SNARE, secretory vesicle fusion [Kappamyces sp. JEL0829]|nr:Plasma membrane t-SNARE, secretory vesicle fusion [Kappamyces sp. JEL0829]